MGPPSAEEFLRQVGLRCTRQRVAVLRSLIESDSPLTHSEVLDAVGDTGIDRVSVYRVLEALTECGIVHRIETGDRLWRFAVCPSHAEPHSGHCHPHFRCRICGQVECLEMIHIPELPRNQSGYRIEEQEIYLKGICPRCQKG